MKNFIEKKALENTDFELNKIGPFAYLIHKMSKEGKYFMNIYDKERLIHNSEIECSKEYSSTSENIDLSNIFSKTGLQNKFRLNNENGYLLFYNSKEFVNLKIIIKNESNVEFDSSKPKKGDLYALNLLKPGLYELKSKTFTNPLKIDIQYPNIDFNRNTVDMETLTISSESKTNLISQPNQGLVIELNEKMTDFTIKLLHENLPEKGESIEEQLKVKLSQTKITNKNHTKENPTRKFTKKFN